MRPSEIMQDTTAATALSVNAVPCQHRSVAAMDGALPNVSLFCSATPARVM
jgi:hypothetical protein